jgi:hypothetical protein
VGVVGLGVSVAVGSGLRVWVGTWEGVSLIVGVHVGPSMISGVLVTVGKPSVGGMVGAAPRSGPGRKGSMISMSPGLENTAAKPLAAIRVARTKPKVRQFRIIPPMLRRLGL